MIDIKKNGVVEFARVDDDGNIWRTTIQPGDTALAQELLDADELAQVQTKWTAKVVSDYEKSLPTGP